jgi:ketosteroid isomerase-like protein
MSVDTPDPLELTRRTYAFLNDHDFDAVVGMFAPMGVWDVSDWGLGTHTGTRAIGSFLKAWFGSMDEYEVQVEDVQHLGDGVVSVVVVQTARPAGTHNTLRVQSAPVFEWREGLIAQVTLYRSVAEGREAAARLACGRALAGPASNVQRLRVLLEPMSGVMWNAARVSSWSSRLELFDRDVVFEDSAMFDETFRGHEGIVEAFRRWIDAFASTRVDLVEIVGEGDKAVSTHRFRATAHHTGIEVKGEYAFLWRFRDGQVVHYQSVTDPASALRAAGLRR